MQAEDPGILGIAAVLFGGVSTCASVQCFFLHGNQSIGPTIHHQAHSQSGGMMRHTLLLPPDDHGLPSHQHVVVRAKESNCLRTT